MAALLAVAGIGTRGAHAEPDPAELEDAPAADAASGIAIPPPRQSHTLPNTLLAAPRLVVRLLLTGPRLAASGLDHWMEGRSANAFGRDVKTRWRFGFVTDWETALGASVGLRLGRKFGEDASADVYGGFFGVRGESGGIRMSLGRYTAASIRPKLSLDFGGDLSRVFAGVGATPGMAGDPYARGPRISYDETMVAASGGASVDLGPIAVIGQALYDDTTATDDGDHPLGDTYDTSMLVGYAESHHATTGELAVVYDGRRASADTYAGPLSTGFYVRGTAAYVDGEAARSGAFSTGRFGIEARRLFDLFHGDRVLSIGVRAEAITAGADDVPFTRLPSLGGRSWMRAFARDELRDRSAAAAQLEYEWPLDDNFRAFVFGEAGGVQPGLDEITAARSHLDFGGGIRVIEGSSAWFVVQAASSDDGDFGILVQLGGL
jgi:hypothetical protein